MSIVKFNFENNKIKLNFHHEINSENKNENRNEYIGDKKRDFIPIQLLGDDGACGKILKIKSTLNNKIYVMKIIPKTLEEKYSKQEINILQILDHPNIVKYYTSFEDKVNYYIIIEYIKGPNLCIFYNTLKSENKIINEKKIWHLLAQSLDALVYIHGKGIIHRDIKFLNILLDENMNIKIIDFNTSVFMDIAAARNYLPDKNDFINYINRGTEIGNYFKAPEMAEGKNYNAKVDVFSLGAVFYELCNINKNYNYDYSNELKEIINLMIITDPDKRPTSNEIYDLYKKNYTKKYFKYSSIFSCLHCIFNYPLWEKEENLKNFQKIGISKNFYDLLYIFHQKYQNFEECIKIFKQNNLKSLYNNNDNVNNNDNDNCEEIDPIAFIEFIFSKLNEEQNIIKPNNNKIKVSKKDNIKEEKYLLYKKNYEKKIKSIISENFFGLLELKTTCSKCRVNDYIFNYYFYLCFNMEFIIEKNIDLNFESIFNYLKKNFERKIYCSSERCRGEYRHEENIRFFSAPKNLIILFDTKKSDSNEKIKINKINFPEIITFGALDVEILEQNYKNRNGDNNPKEIKYYLSSILCQIDNDEGNELYISFTRDFSINSDNINNIDNNNYYNFNEVKNKYNIIGLFYLSSEIEIINNYKSREKLYKLNICKNDENYFNQISIQESGNNINNNLNSIHFNNQNNIFNMNKNNDICNNNKSDSSKNNNNIMINNESRNILLNSLNIETESCKTIHINKSNEYSSNNMNDCNKGFINNNNINYCQNNFGNNNNMTNNIKVFQNNYGNNNNISNHQNYFRKNNNINNICGNNNNINHNQNYFRNNNFNINNNYINNNNNINNLKNNYGNNININNSYINNNNINNLPNNYVNNNNINNLPNYYGNNNINNLPNNYGNNNNVNNDNNFNQSKISNNYINNTSNISNDNNLNNSSNISNNNNINNRNMRNNNSINKGGSNISNNNIINNSNIINNNISNPNMDINNIHINNSNIINNNNFNNKRNEIFSEDKNISINNNFQGSVGGINNFNNEYFIDNSFNQINPNYNYNNRYSNSNENFNSIATFNRISHNNSIFNNQSQNPFLNDNK